jgi:hypothetical protein
VPVRALYLRPVHGQAEGVSLLGPDKKEVALIRPGDPLDPASQALLQEELRLRYPIATIHRIRRAWIDGGQRFLAVDTDRGRRTFVVRNPTANIQECGPGLMFKDAVGNRFRIADLADLDPVSCRLLARVVM